MTDQKINTGDVVFCHYEDELHSFDLITIAGGRVRGKPNERVIQIPNGYSSLPESSLQKLDFRASAPLHILASDIRISEIVIHTETRDISIS